MDERFAEIAAEVLELDVEELEDDLGPESVDLWDSLAQLRLVTALEQEFRIEFTMEEIESIDSIGRLREIVRGQVGSA